MIDWTPLHELPPPPRVDACSLCQLSCQRSRVIWAEGCYHPLAARRRPNLLPYLVEDLRLAARIAVQ